MNDDQIECSEQMSVVCGLLEHEWSTFQEMPKVFNGEVHN